MKRAGARSLLFCVAAGIACLAGSWTSWREVEAPDGELAVLRYRPGSSLMAQVAHDLKSGEYMFFPNRRSVWVINRTNGRLAVYTFLNNEYSTIERSRVGQIDLTSFPTENTHIEISDRNLNSNLWVCNSRTGDVQLWSLARDGELRTTGPVATSIDLMERP